MKVSGFLNKLMQVIFEDGHADVLSGKFFGYVDGYDECWIMGGCED